MDFIEKVSNTSEEVSRRREKTEKELKERDLKLRKFKQKVLVVATISALALTSITSYKLGQKNPERESVTTEMQISPTCNIYDASPEVLNAWADYEMNRYDQVAQEKNIPNSMYESYYLPIKYAYNNYTDTNDEKYKEQLKSQVLIFEKELKDAQIGNYSFGSSPFIYSVVKEGQVLIPYTDDINNGIAPAEAQTINFDNMSVVYVPANSINNNNSIKM